jgi:hypothetical protein
VVTWEGGLKEAPTQDAFCVGQGYQDTIIFREWGYDLHEQKKKKETCSIFWQFLFIICIILTKWSLTHFAELRGLRTLAQGCILRKWKKAREPPFMIKRPKDRIPELVMWR